MAYEKNFNKALLLIQVMPILPAVLQELPYQVRQKGALAQ